MGSCLLSQAEASRAAWASAGLSARLGEDFRETSLSLTRSAERIDGGTGCQEWLWVAGTHRD